jgi:hypothetical protein
MLSGESYRCYAADATDINVYFDPYPSNRLVCFRFEYPVVFHTATNIV